MQGMYLFELIFVSYLVLLFLSYVVCYLGTEL